MRGACSGFGEEAWDLLVADGDEVGEDEHPSSPPATIQQGDHDGDHQEDELDSRARDGLAERCGLVSAGL